MKSSRILLLFALISPLWLLSGAKADRQPGIPFSDIKQNCSNQATTDDADEASTQDTENTIDLVLLIDQSISLRDSKSDFQGTKKQNLELLREALKKVKPLLISGSQLRIGVITFSGSAQVIRNLNEGPIAQSDYDNFVRRVSDPGNLRSYTNYIDAISASTDQFRNFSEAENCRVLLWFTDGEVDLSGQDPEEDGRSLLVSFCGQNGEPNQTEQLAKLNVLTFVVLLNDNTFPTMGSVPENQQRRQDSIIGLRGLTGDWSEMGEPDLVPSAPCDDERPSRQGEVIKVDDVDGLVKQILEFVIRGITDSEFCPEEKLSLNELPSGQLFDFIVINSDETASLVEPSELAGRKFPIVLDRLNPDDAATLDSLDRGWNLRLDANSQYLCFGYRIRSGITFQASEKSTTLRIGDECSVVNFQLDADIVDFGGLLVGQSFTDLASNDTRVKVVDSSKLKIGAECKDRGSELREFPAALRLVDSELGGDGRSILDQNSVMVNLRLSQPVTVIGKEGIPRFVCEVKSDEGSFELVISHRNEEVSKDPYRSVGTCRFENVGIENGSIRFTISPPIAIGEKAAEVVILDPITGEMIAEVQNSSELAGRTFTIGTLEALPNKDFDLLTKGLLKVDFDDGREQFEIGEADVIIELNLFARSNRIWALVVALIASFVAMVLSYLFLHRILRQTASLGAHGSVSSVTTSAEFQIASDGSQMVQWLGSVGFTPRVADLEAIPLHNAADTRVGRLRLRVRVGKLHQPVVMLKEPWTEIVSEDSQVISVLANPVASNSYKYSDPRVSTTKAPLGSSVILELFAVGADKDRRQGRLTFIVKNRGSFEEQISSLKREVNALAKTALNNEKNAKNQPKKANAASETTTSPIDGPTSQEPKRPPR